VQNYHRISEEAYIEARNLPYNLPEKLSANPR